MTDTEKTEAVNEAENNGITPADGRFHAFTVKLRIFCKEHKTVVVISLIGVAVLVWISVMLASSSGYLVNDYKSDYADFYFDFADDGKVYMKYNDRPLVFHSGTYKKEKGVFILDINVLSNGSPTGETMDFTAKKSGNNLIVNGEGLKDVMFYPVD